MNRSSPTAFIQHPGTEPLVQRVRAITAAVRESRFAERFGTVTEVRPPVVLTAFENLKLGDLCRIHRANDSPILAEAVGIRKEGVVLSPLGPIEGVARQDRVQWYADRLQFPFHKRLLGTVLDGLGNQLDGSAAPEYAALRPAKAAGASPMDRPLITHTLLTGCNVIDTMLTIGRGQRLGIFGPPGTGKSSLLATIASQCSADVVVIGLIGERGREVKEFLDRLLPAEKRKRVVVVAATSERPPKERVYAAHVATSVAEGFRDQGKSVLLLIDSMTRVARALREIGLASGEAPTRRGYPASVYPALPELIERAGRGRKGDITALYTVLVEGESESDPIAEEVRSLTDGHIELSPALAAAGQFPAIDVRRSLSRVMPHVVPDTQIALAADTRALIAKHDEIELLVQIGEFKSGNDPLADRAVRVLPEVRKFFARTDSTGTGLQVLASELSRIIE